MTSEISRQTSDFSERAKSLVSEAQQSELAEESRNLLSEVEQLNTK